MKGAWSLVHAADELTRVQPAVDTSVGALIGVMNVGSKLAKEHAPVKGRYASKDSVVREMLREIIKSAHIVKVYCEKRPEGVCRVKHFPLYGLTVSPYSTRAFDREDHRIRSRRGTRWLFPCSRDFERKACRRCRPRLPHRDPSYGEYNYSGW